MYFATAGWLTSKNEIELITSILWKKKKTYKLFDISWWKVSEFLGKTLKMYMISFVSRYFKCDYFMQKNRSKSNLGLSLSFQIYLFSEYKMGKLYFAL